MSVLGGKRLTAVCNWPTIRCERRTNNVLSRPYRKQTTIDVDMNEIHADTWHIIDVNVVKYANNRQNSASEHDRWISQLQSRCHMEVTVRTFQRYYRGTEWKNSDDDGHATILVVERYYQVNITNVMSPKLECCKQIDRLIDKQIRKARQRTRGVIHRVDISS